MYASALTAAQKRGEILRMRRAQRFTGEGLVFSIQEGKVEEFLQSRGFVTQNRGHLYFALTAETAIL
jgi:hypothetical protein